MFTPAAVAAVLGLELEGKFAEAVKVIWPNRHLVVCAINGAVAPL